MMSGMDTRTWTVDLTGRMWQVEVDGVPQTGLERVSADCVSGQDPQLYLTFTAGGRFAGAGEVHVVESGAQAIRAWLDGIDPEELEQAALAAQETTMGPTSPGQAFLAGLRRLADASA